MSSFLNLLANVISSFYDTLIDNNSCDHLVIDVNVDDAKIEDDAVLNQKNHQSSTDEIFHNDGKFESDCKENEATNLIKCDQPVIMLVEGVYLNIFTFFNRCKVI